MLTAEDPVTAQKDNNRKIEPCEVKPEAPTRGGVTLNRSQASAAKPRRTGALNAGFAAVNAPFLVKMIREKRQWYLPLYQI
jgi:hypothetical protein